MAGRDLSLTTRVENVRELKKVTVPVHFSKEEIKEHFKDSMKEVKAQFNVAQELFEKGDENGYKIILRSQVVLAEGLLDFYLHEVSKYCMFQMFCGNWDKTEKYASFMVPMSKVEEAMAVSSTSEWFFEYLNNRFSRDVFLSVESMREQLNLIGVGFVKAMVKAFPRVNEQESNKTGAKIVEELFKRRNEIAHQNDRSHATAEQTDISRGFVEMYIGNIECIVEGIYAVMVENDAIN